MSDNIFGEELRRIRKGSPVLLKDLCAEMGWSKTYIMGLEKGRSAPPRPEKIRKLCDVLGRLDLYATLLNCSLKTKGKLELSLEDASDLKFDLATLLTEHWDTLDEKTQKALCAVLIEDATRSF